MLALRIRAVISRLNPDVPVRFSSLHETFAGALAPPRFRAVLVSAFALLAVLLAVIGVYGVVSHLVAERTPEIGLRLAIGASRREIFTSVVGGSMHHVVWGLLLGVGAHSPPRARCVRCCSKSGRAIR